MKSTSLLITFFIGLLFICSTTVYAQEKPSRLDFRFGVGTSLQGSGDMITLSFDNELNYRLNNYFATSLSISHGKSESGVFKMGSFIQGNLNAFVSPFRNNRRNDFRLGIGLGVQNYVYSYIQSEEYINGQLIQSPVYRDKNGLGRNIIIENTFALTQRLLLGLKLYNQFYNSGDVNTGIMLKAGVQF
ncbi:hypothetical protein [Algivirga pacifica]|uniref:Outer membrane protein beta-barrel domain-containing protein n=1 Tax=Algivirga pacifica TaxID=1162670 RepID=A0ABP9DIW0_9BACT